MFFELLSKLIMLEYQQNLHVDSLNTATHDKIKIRLLFQDFPVKNPKRWPKCAIFYLNLE